MKEINIKHVLNGKEISGANGQVERYKCTILDQLLASTDNEEMWDEGERKVQLTLNSRINSATRNPYMHCGLDKF